VQEQESIPAGANLDNWSEDPWKNGVQVDRMEDMEKLVIQTRNSLYEIIIIDGRSGEILVRGGQFFPELTPARLAGATLGAASAKCADLHRLPDGNQRQRPADCDHSRRIIAILA